MPLEDDGFLSEEAQEHAAKEAAEYRQIFNYLKDVNAKAHQFLHEVRSDPEDGKHVFALAFFARALSAFQALRVLAERGFITECRVTCRNLFEVKFRLGFLEHKSDAVAILVAEHARLKIKRLRDMRDGNVQLGSNLEKPDWNAAIAKHETLLRNPDGSERTMPSIRALAKVSGFESDYVGYYSFLSEATHSGAGELEDYVEFDDKSGEVTGFNYGPQAGIWLPWTTLLAASVLIDCLAITNRIVGARASPIQRFLEQKEEEMLQRYHELMMLGARGNP
jgi:Family of unknown function (DUF5677)